MQTKRKIKILAIDPGTREMGYAHLENNDLVDYGVRFLRRNKRLEHMLVYLTEITNRIIMEKHPSILVIEKSSFSHANQNAALMLAIGRVKAVGKKHKMRIYEYAPRTIKKAVCDSGNSTKKEIVRTLAIAYPELKYYVGSDKRYKEEHFQMIFDALACGITYLKLKYHICQKGMN